MQLATALCGAGVAALLIVAAPALAQNNSDRALETQFDTTLGRLNAERETIEELQRSLEQETDIVRGCATLNRSLTHLNNADDLLEEMNSYANQLRRRDQMRAIGVQREAIAEQIALKEGDIARMCQDLPPPQG